MRPASGSALLIVKEFLRRFIKSNDNVIKISANAYQEFLATFTVKLSVNQLGHTFFSFQH